MDRVKLTDIQKELLEKFYAIFRYDAKDEQFSELVNEFCGVDKEG